MNYEGINVVLIWLKIKKNLNSIAYFPKSDITHPKNKDVERESKIKAVPGR